MNNEVTKKQVKWISVIVKRYNCRKYEKDKVKKNIQSFPELFALLPFSNGTCRVIVLASAIFVPTSDNG